jgi:hypothetical protein
MEESKLDMLAPKEEQLKILVPYLEKAAEGQEVELPITGRTRVLVLRYMGDWSGLYTKDGLTPKGALIYYKKLMKEE